MRRDSLVGNLWLQVAGYEGLIRGGSTGPVAAIDALCCDVELTTEEGTVCQQVHGLLPAAKVTLDRVRKLHRQDKANSFLLPLPTPPTASGDGDGGAASASSGVPEPAATGRAVAIYPVTLA